MNSGSKIKVLIIDDSAVVRKLLTSILSSDPEIEVVGTAVDALVARDKIKRLNPDVLTLDVEMPKMDGITFLRNVMRLHPMPVIMVSTLTEKGAAVTLDALEYGAVDFVCKPKIDISNTLEDYSSEIIQKVKHAKNMRVKRYQERPKIRHIDTNAGENVRYSVDEIIPQVNTRKHINTTDKIIAIGASTGGTEAISEILETLPINTPGIVISQHIPETFSKPFADRVNSRCAITVSEAQDGDMIIPGHAYISPGNRHLIVVKDGARWRCKLSDDVPVNRHKPSVDVMFRSVANSAGPNALGVILTGMGKDGAQGLKDMLDSGSKTIAQDEASSVVWGMPGSAVQLGAAQKVISLESISNNLVSTFA